MKRPVLLLLAISVEPKGAGQRGTHPKRDAGLALCAIAPYLELVDGLGSFQTTGYVTTHEETRLHGASQVEWPSTTSTCQKAA